MYMEDVCRIQTTDDDKYIVTFMMPKKPGKGNKASDMSVGPPTEDKVFVADDEQALVALIQEYLPNAGKTDAQKFEKGFNKK